MVLLEMMCRECRGTHILVRGLMEGCWASRLSVQELANSHLCSVCTRCCDAINFAPYLDNRSQVDTASRYQVVSRKRISQQDDWIVFVEEKVP